MNIKQLFSLTFIWLMYFVGASQNTFVPDNNFEQYLIDLGLDAGPLDNFVPTTNIANIINLDVSNKNISDLTGIEDFSSLSNLNCNNNNLSFLDVTQNTNLTQLYCNFNQLNSIDVTQNTALDIFWCENNNIGSLDVSQNIRLISLITNNNPLNTLDVTNNTLLSVFQCRNNQLTDLDISKNTLLTQLYCDFNFLTDLDTSNNTELTSLYCGDNQITSLDVSKNTKLTRLWCTRNQLLNLDVTQNINLVELTIGDNQIASIDLSKNTQLIRLWAAKNLLTELDVSNNLLLEDISTSINLITRLDVSKNSNLTSLDIDHNNLCSLNVKNGNNTNMVVFSAINNTNLSCIFVDNVAYSVSNWTNVDNTSNFVTTQAECDAYGNLTPPVDVLNDFIGNSFTLPVLNNGNYFTASGGNGTALSSGDVITTSQTIYIFNDTGCYTNESSFNVVITQDTYYIPKFFTPNNDGSHDTWQVLDNSNTIHTIYIYNRYGKLLKSITPNGEGWNGTFNGQAMESNDYWYAITLNTGEMIKGHFTLKR